VVNRVVVAFNRPIREFALSPREARQFAELIRLTSYKAQGGTKADRKLKKAGM
jgi:hypothetical protein